MTPEQLSAAIRAALQSAVDAGDLTVTVPAEVRVERPRNRDHGDWSTNVALQLAKGAGIPPRELAAALATPPRRTCPGVKAVDVAGPGFLNITLDAASAGELARSIVEAGADLRAQHRRGGARRQPRVHLGQPHRARSTSATPGGPRWATRCAACSPRPAPTVAAEYYINDAGAQMDKFGASVLARAAGQEPPEDGYPGAYVADRAAEVLAQRPDLLELDPAEALDVARDLGYVAQLAAIRRTLDELRGALRRLVLRAQPARGPRRRAGRRPAARAGPRLRRRGRGVAAHHRLRRRQGPRPHPRRRQPHLLRRRRRLLPQQEGPRVRREGLPPRRRPPRLHQPAQGHRRRARATTPSTTSRSRSASSSPSPASGWASGSATPSTSTS